MEFRGRWTAENGGSRSGSLRAWGEWEAESEIIRELIQPNQDPMYPRYLWRTFYILKNNYRLLHNTDPFIFGDQFLYSNCGQRKTLSLTRLERGSVIAFGSGKKVAGEWKWVLDTVFVVANSLMYTTTDSEVRRELADSTPKAFLIATVCPIMANEKASFRLYRGATPENPVDGMYSYFPAMPAQGDRGFPRPLIELPGEYFNPRSFRSPKGVWNARTSKELIGIWNSLKDQTLQGRT